MAGCLFVNCVAWSGVAWRGVAWRGVAWRGVAWRGVAWRGVAWRGVALILFSVSCSYDVIRDIHYLITVRCSCIRFVEKECTDVSLRLAFKLDALRVIIYRSNVHFHALMSLSLSSNINMHFLFLSFI